MKLLQLTKDGLAQQDVTMEEFAQRMAAEGDLTLPPHLRANATVAGSTPGTGQPLSDAELSPARARLEKLRQNSSGKLRVESAIIEGEAWFIKRLDFAGLTRLALMTPRDKNGMLDLNKADNLSSLMTAMLESCVVCGLEDITPFFTYAEAYDWAYDTAADVVKIVAELFAAILTVNPQILPEREENEESDGEEAAEEAYEREKKDGSGSLENAPSTMPPTTSEVNGSSDTASSDAPAISPDESENSQSTAEETPPSLTS